MIEGELEDGESLEGKPISKLSEAMFEAIRWDKPETARAIFDAGWTYQWIDSARGGPMGRQRDEGPPVWSPMIFAAFENSTECLKLLLELGAPAGEAARDNGLTALHFAAQSGDPEAVIALLAAGADPNVRGFNGQRPLHRAIFPGCEDGARALLLAGADPNALTDAGESPLESILRETEASVFLELLRGGADPSVALKDKSQSVEDAARKSAWPWRAGERDLVLGALTALREAKELAAAAPRAVKSAPRSGSL